MFRPTRHTTPAVLALALVIALPPLAAAQDVPFVAQIIDPTVAVRAGAGRSFYVVGQLTMGSQVTVDEVVFGWYKIKPPAETYSYVSRAFVDAFGDGRTGTINSSRAAVRAASVNGAGESYRRQIDLLEGQTVQIVGQEDSFYKIVPPEGAYVFLPPGSIRLMGVNTEPPTPAADEQVTATPTDTGHAPAADPARPSPQQPATPPMEQQRGTAPVASDTPGPDPQPNTPVRPLQPASAALKQAEAKLMEAQQLPLEQQPIPQLLQTYQSLADTPELSLVDRRIVALRVAQLRRKAAVAKALEDIAAAQQEHRELSRFVDQVAQQEPPKPRYQVRGQLLPSTVYNGTNLPRLYRVTEADGQRIVAYARLRSGLDAANLLGQYVGVVGTIKHDPTLNLEVIDAEQIDVIRSTAAR